MAHCTTIDVYIDGPAPLQNPDGPIALRRSSSAPRRRSTQRPQPATRLDVGGFVLPRADEPAMRNNRTEIADVLAALDVLGQLPHGGPAGRHATMWCDN